jgi:hypothetical protein
MPLAACKSPLNLVEGAFILFQSCFFMNYRPLCLHSGGFLLQRDRRTDIIRPYVPPHLGRFPPGQG